MRLKSILREPLLHFLAIGAALFLYFHFSSGGSAGPGSTRIVISPGQIAHLEAGFTRTWSRPPSEVELKGLIDEWVREEIAVREAMSAGLDRDDTVIRRRLRQKLEFLIEDSAEASPPTDEELKAWLAQHADEYRTEPRVAFRQVFVSRDRRGAAAEADAAADPRSAWPPQDRRRGSTPSATRRCCRPTSISLRCATSTGRSAPVSRGSLTRPSRASGAGPIRSGYGLHLVLVRERVEGALPDLDGAASGGAARGPGRAPQAPTGRDVRPLAREVHGGHRAAGGAAGPGERLRRQRRAGRDAARLRGAARGDRRCSSARSHAHETRPGYLELRESDPATYALLWKRPTGGEVEIQIAPVVPEGCRLVTPDQQQLTPGAVVVRGTLQCRGGLAGKTLRISGLETTITDVLVRIEHADGRVESHLLRPASPSVTLGAATSGFERAASYLQLGVQHILLGVDHLLFVLGLLLIVRDRWMLVKTITAFTVAHSLTLAIATLGYASAPLLPLNAAIALSILFLGPEIVRVWRGETSFTIRHPWVVAFAVRAAARIRLCQRTDGDGPAEGRDPARAAAVQRRRRTGPDRVRGAGPAAGARVSRAADPAGRATRRRCRAMRSARSARTGRSSARRSCWEPSDESPRPALAYCSRRAVSSPGRPSHTSSRARRPAS